MSNSTNIAKIRKPALPTIVKNNQGKERLLGGRWNMLRVGEFLQSKPNWQSMDDLARFVYGSTSQKTRDNVRKHVPGQRRYMLDKDTPIVTEYGSRGIIIAIKIFDRTNDADKIKFSAEISKAKERKEISERRYDDLTRLFLLQDKIVRQ